MERLGLANIIMGFILTANTLVSYFVYGYKGDMVPNMIIAVAIIVLSFIKHKSAQASMFLIAGAIVSLFGTNDNFSGIFFILIGCYVMQNRTFTITSLLIVIVALIVKYSITEMKLPSFFNMVVAYAYFTYIFYFLFQIGRVLPSYKSKGLTIEQVETIEKLLQGKSHKEAAEELGLIRTTFSMRVSSLRRRYKVKNDFQLALILAEEGVININTLSEVNIVTKPL